MIIKCANREHAGNHSRQCVYNFNLNLLAYKNYLCAALGISRDTSDVNLVRNNINQVEECHYEPIDKKRLCIQ